MIIILIVVLKVVVIIQDWSLGRWLIAWLKGFEWMNEWMIDYLYAVSIYFSIYFYISLILFDKNLNFFRNNLNNQLIKISYFLKSLY